MSDVVQHPDVCVKGTDRVARQRDGYLVITIRIAYLIAVSMIVLNDRSYLFSSFLPS